MTAILAEFGVSAMANPIEIDDAIVLLLGAGVDQGGRARIEGVTRLEKLIFLLERETHSDQWLSEDAEFVAYNFGPFSRKVYDAVDTLAAAGIITDSARFAPDDMDTWEEREAITDKSDNGYSYTTRDFELTDRGWRYFAALDEEMKPEALKELTSFKARFAPLPLRQLVRYVYQRYDEFTTNSLIRDDILGHHS
ncbi:hypothetical protein [Curtobacterium sp. VKM Ac-2884]|uniref:hypothetical protein n=1 Tax=Curtobacterium sp. VKM Ac-2884 TaxID=2783818 RepID=UPI00188BB66F|nr:hypothetical protein [Curtobacterium sp. VKM Ac-2884]MBF4603131.1 hypothetical protein [Curtobacterium sp. VKM Ac-2884]